MENENELLKLLGAQLCGICTRPIEHDPSPFTRIVPHPIVIRMQLEHMCRKCKAERSGFLFKMPGEGR